METKERAMAEGVMKGPTMSFQGTHANRAPGPEPRVLRSPERSASTRSEARVRLDAHGVRGPAKRSRLFPRCCGPPGQDAKPTGETPSHRCRRPRANLSTAAATPATSQRQLRCPRKAKVPQGWSMRSIEAMSSSASTGFAMCWWYPASRARWASSARAYAVRAIAGMSMFCARRWRMKR